ncbi:MAG: glycine cleavage system protein GcvH [Legionellaceae bacterium]|nr:glycine cleavage system protein GcvH [Legionellaceae bacterium]
MTSKKFTKTHEWVEAEDANYAIGISEHAQSLLGDLVFVELPEIGSSWNAGQEMGVLESVKAAADFYAPVSGTVVAVNTEIQANPGLVNESPEERGWLVRLAISRPTELETLLSDSEYKDLISQEG